MKGFKGASLSALLVVLLIAPAISTMLFSSVSPVYAQADNLIIIVRGNEYTYNLNNDNTTSDYYYEEDVAIPPEVWYELGDLPPIMAVKKVGEGGVAAIGISYSLRDATTGGAKWSAEAGGMDVLFDKVFQWMNPGATEILWYEGHDVYSRETSIGSSEFVSALVSLGYSVSGRTTEPIDNDLLTPYDILIIPPLQEGDGSVGGDPDRLLDAEVQAIASFAENGGGVLVLAISDYFGFSRYYNVQNKILDGLNFGMHFQDDQINEDTYYYSAVVDNTTEIGAAYYAAQGSELVHISSACSLALVEAADGDGEPTEIPWVIIAIVVIVGVVGTVAAVLILRRPHRVAPKRVRKKKKRK